MAAIRIIRERLGLRIADAIPALMVFGPIGAVASIVAASLADLRIASA